MAVLHRDSARPTGFILLDTTVPTFRTRDLMSISGHGCIPPFRMVSESRPIPTAQSLSIHTGPDPESATATTTATVLATLLENNRRGRMNFDQSPGTPPNKYGC